MLHKKYVNKHIKSATIKLSKNIINFHIQQHNQFEIKKFNEYVLIVSYK